MADVNPKIGPVSGGTRLYLSGSNLNVGSRISIFLDETPCALDRRLVAPSRGSRANQPQKTLTNLLNETHNSQLDSIQSNRISCVTAPYSLGNSMRISRLTLTIDNSTHYLPYPFNYQPDPIITSIEPAESFLSGGRLILIGGQHLLSPQSTKLMVYYENKQNIVNSTSCMAQNDTLLTCLTPYLSREVVSNLLALQQQQQRQFDSNGQPAGGRVSPDDSPLSYESGGLKLRMMFAMDDVKSVRNLDDYYHHLPHFLTYFEDPQLFPLRSEQQPGNLVAFQEELRISGEHLSMRQLEQDMMITIGAHYCAIKTIAPNFLLCEPPAKIDPIRDETGKLVERPVLPIVGLVGAHLRYQLGYMQYSARQYKQLAATANSDGQLVEHPLGSASFAQQETSSSFASPSFVVLLLLSLIGFLVAFSTTFAFAVARFRQSKAEREYKRIQLQMGSLDINGQPIGGPFATSSNLFDKIHLATGGGGGNQIVNGNVRSRAIDYVGGALSTSGKKLGLCRFGASQRQQQQPQPQPQGLFHAPSPLTDISSLIGSSPISSQHVVKLAANGTIVNSATSQNAHHYYAIGNAAAASGPDTSSPSSSSSSAGGGSSLKQHLFTCRTSGQPQPNNNRSMQVLQQQADNQQDQLAACLATNQQQQKSNLLIVGQQQLQTDAGNSRNFNWTQEAPSTIVPYAVIEACNLTLEGKNAIKEYV